MIEKYFSRGIRFKWTEPTQDASGSKDGSIIDNPHRPASALVYDGLDGELYKIGGVNVTTLGFRMGMRLNYSWLVYSHGRTTRISTPNDVLTGPMSGCIIAVWTEQGRRYVGHVGTVESSEVINQKVKGTFGSMMPQNTIGFNPAAAWNPSEIRSLMSKFKKLPAFRIMALVTTANQFYSVLMFKINGTTTEWCVGGNKKVSSINYQALKAKFIPRGSLSDGRAFGSSKFIK